MCHWDVVDSRLHLGENDLADEGGHKTWGTAVDSEQKWDQFVKSQNDATLSFFFSSDEHHSKEPRQLSRTKETEE